MNLRFENDVKMYGTQAPVRLRGLMRVFENDVKMYGTQANGTYVPLTKVFENDVKMYGTQAKALMFINSLSLRMM